MAAHARGFTLVELMIGAVLAAIAGMAALLLMQSSRDGAGAAGKQAQQTGWLREASIALAEELAMTTTSRFTVSALVDGNHAITFQRPISTSGAVTAWGAYDPLTTSPTRLLPDHFTRFTIVSEGAQRALVRQVLDPSLTLVRQEVVARGLAAGTSTPAGLRCTPNGDMWRIVLGLAPTGGRPADALTFDVAFRN